MYPDSLISVTQTEEKLKQRKADAALQAKKRLADTRADGENAVEAAIRKAVAEIDAMSTRVDESFHAQAGQRAYSAENKKAVMRAKAESRMDKAAAFIAERIVSG